MAESGPAQYASVILDVSVDKSLDYQIPGALVGKLLLQAAVADVVFGDHQQAGGVLVETVNDAGALPAANLR